MAQAHDHRQRVEGLELVRAAAVRRLEACLCLLYTSDAADE